MGKDGQEGVGNGSGIGYRKNQTQRALNVEKVGGRLCIIRMTSVRWLQYQLGT